MVCVVSCRSLPLSIQRIASAEPGDIGRCMAVGLGLRWMWSGGGEVTSCTDRVGEWGTYWTNDDNKTDMWCAY